MAKKFYLDSCIWLDYFGDRKDGLRPLGEFAFQFLKKCENNNFSVLVSDTVVLELETILPKEQVKEIFSSFKRIIQKVNASAEEVSEARKEWNKRSKNIPFKDILHAIISKNNNAVIISRDRHFLEDLSLIVEVQKPENLL